MSKLNEQQYFEEIIRFTKKITGYNVSISSKDRQFIEKLIQNNIPPGVVKELIKKEVSRYPPEKRKKFRLSQIKPYLDKLPQKTQSAEKKLKKTQSYQIPEELEDAYTRLEVLNRIWKNLPVEEKEKIISQAVEKMKKGFILTNINQKKVLKSLIREILAKKYNIK